MQKISASDQRALRTRIRDRYTVSMATRLRWTRGCLLQSWMPTCRGGPFTAGF
jgi:hypothetical protein